MGVSETNLTLDISFCLVAS